MFKQTDKKVKAAIIGGAVGDALGVPVEFSKREELARNPVTDMRGFGTYPMPQGSWSDDTSMTLCALDVFANGKYNAKAVMDNFATWFYEGKYTPTGRAFDSGDICAQVINDYVNKHIAYNKCGAANEYSNGNGSLMRIMPYSLFCRTIRQVENGSILTHAHRRSVIACGIHAFIVRELLKNPSKSAIKEGLHKAQRHYRFDPEWQHYSRLSNIESYTEKDIRSSAYVVETFEAALWCIMTTNDYASCVLKAVNLGSDTDTVASIAGGLAGLLYGYDSIPDVWKSQIARFDWIVELCEKAALRNSRVLL